MPGKILAALSVSIVVCSNLHAQENNINETVDETIIVYGLRLQQPETEVGSSVSILTAGEISALGVDYVLDAVATMPGVTINQNGAFGGSASVRIRGASSEQTLVIVDGVVSNDPTSPGGGYDFARLDPNNIERIEVLKGPQSTLWGTDAMGGVVNIVTKRSRESFAGSAFAQAGSFNSLRGGAEISAASERFDYRLSATSTSTDGISKADENNGNSEDDSFESTSINAGVGVKFANDVEVRLSALWTDAESEFDSFSFGDQGNTADGDELSTTEEIVSNLSLTVPLFDGKLNNSFLLGYTDINRENLTDGVSSFISEGDRIGFRYQGELTVNENNRIVLGAEREENESNGEENSIDGTYALYELQAHDTLTLTAGVRRDDHEVFGGETTRRFAAAYNPNDAVTLRLSWGEGFKAPTLFQTTFFCCGAVGPNTDLQPETSDGVDIGITVRTPDARGEVGLTYFDQDTTNLITFSFGIGGYENIAEATSKGFELSARYQFVEWLEASLSYASIDAEDGAGAPLIRVPEHSGNLRLSFAPESDFSGSVMLRYNGEEQDPNGVVPSWTRIDLTARYRLSDSIELYTRIENALDEEYQQIIGYGTPDRSAYIGARLRF